MEKVERRILTEHQEDVGAQHLPRGRQVFDCERVFRLEVAEVQVEVHDNGHGYHVVEEDKKATALHQIYPLLPIGLPRPRLLINFVFLKESRLKVIDQIHGEVADKKPYQVPDLQSKYHHVEFCNSIRTHYL